MRGANGAKWGNPSLRLAFEIRTHHAAAHPPWFSRILRKITGGPCVAKMTPFLDDNCRTLVEIKALWRMGGRGAEMRNPASR